MAPSSLSLERAHSLYLVALRAQDSSPHTIALYGSVLRLHRGWLSETLGKPPTLAHLNPDLMRRWAIWLADGKRKPNTLRHYQRILKTFAAWLANEGVLTTDPLARVKLPREKQIEPPVLTDDELGRLAAMCQDTLQPFRNRAMLLLLADTGVRVSGLAGMNLGDLELATGKDSQGRVRVRLKGGDVTSLPFGKKAAQAIQQYLLLERDGSDDPESPLFLGRVGERITDKLVRRMTAELGKAAGVAPGKTNPHSLRHYAATSWGAAGMSAFQIQDRLGHSSLEMSRRYVHLGQQRAERAYSVVDALPIRALPSSRRALRLRRDPRLGRGKQAG